MVKRFLLLAGLVALAPAQLDAHPLHTTLTEVRIVRGPRGQVAELRIRAFVDDFSAAVARAAGRTPPPDSSIVAGEAAAYLTKTVVLGDAHGRAVPVEWCGYRRERGVIWLCMRTRVPVRLEALVLSHRMHMELFGDQVNLVQTIDGARRSSMLFTSRDQRKPLKEARGGSKRSDQGRWTIALT